MAEKCRRLCCGMIQIYDCYLRAVSWYYIQVNTCIARNIHKIKFAARACSVNTLLKSLTVNRLWAEREHTFSWAWVYLELNVNILWAECEQTHNEGSFKDLDLIWCAKLGAYSSAVKLSFLAIVEWMNAVFFTFTCGQIVTAGKGMFHTGVGTSLKDTRTGYVFHLSHILYM